MYKDFTDKFLSMAITTQARTLSWQAQFAEIYAARYLLRNLVSRDLKVRYKDSLLGILWSLINPLLIMGVFTVVFSKFFSRELPAYPIFVLVGIMPWNFFNSSVMGGAQSIVGNSTLVKKVYFPRILLPTAIILSNLVSFFIFLIVLVVFLYLFGIGITRHAIWVPLIAISQILFTLGLVYFLAAAQVFYRDISQALDVIMLALFFITPVFYSLEEFNRTAIFGIAFEPARVMRWINPMASIIDGYRTVLWGTFGTGEPTSMGLDFIFRTVVTCVVTFIFGYWFFYRVEHLFGEKL